MRTSMLLSSATASAMWRWPTRVHAAIAALKIGRLGARCARSSVLLLSGPGMPPSSLLLQLLASLLGLPTAALASPPLLLLPLLLPLLLLSRAASKSWMPAAAAAAAAALPLPPMTLVVSGDSWHPKASRISSSTGKICPLWLYACSSAANRLGHSSAAQRLSSSPTQPASLAAAIWRWWVRSLLARGVDSSLVARPPAA